MTTTNYPPPDQERACLRCLWWVKHNSVIGQCRRMPPKREETGEGFWPMTGRADWCGEFKGTTPGGAAGGEGGEG